MRHPPQISIRPASSRVYRLFASALTIILIALGAYFIRAIGQFDLKNGPVAGIVIGLLAACSVWLLLDAWRRPSASQRQWVFSDGLWAQSPPEGSSEGPQIPGTLRLHLDLQSYMLVSFAPSMPTKPFFLRTTQWFHLEASQEDFASRPQRWLALRRAVLAPPERGHEELAA
jgi:hypothetical protein